MKKIKIISILLLLLIFTNITIAKEITVVFDYPVSSDFIDIVTVNEDANAYTALILVADNNGVNLDLGYFDGMGHYINTINDISPGATEYWGFFSNNISASTGITSHIPLDQETISFSLIDFSYEAADYNFITKNNGTGIDAQIFIGSSNIVFDSTGSNGVLETTQTFIPGTYNIIAKYNGEELSNSVIIDGTNRELEFNFSISETNVIDDAINWITSNIDSHGQVGNGAVWGNAFSLMALSLFNDNNNAKEYIQNYLLDNQGETAGFSYPGYSPDAGHSAVSTIAILANNNSLEFFDVNTVTTVDFLTTKQETDGGFSGWGTSDNDTTAWGTIAYSGANISLPTKNSLTAIDFMVSTQNTDGGFGYSAGDDSTVDYTSEVLIALASQDYSKNNIVDDAISYLQDQIDVNGCIDNAYKTSLTSLALNAYDEDVDFLNNCVESLQFEDGGFSRNDNSTSTDTALAILALEKAVFPLTVAEAQDNNGIISVHSIVEFVLTITNNGRVSAKNIDIELTGIDSSWINNDLSDLSIFEIKAGETTTAKVYVETKEVGDYEIIAKLTGEGIVTTKSSNALPFEIDAANLDLVLSMN